MDLERPEHVWQLLHPQLPDSFPPLTLVARRRNNLPQQLNAFVGRDEAVAQLLGSFTRTHLLTLTGAGGIAKTRLALRLAAELGDEYADGVWLVRLESVSDPALVAAPVASVLSVREQPGQPLHETLRVAFSNRQMLLILDNGEHLAEACANLAETLRILTTSREALRIPGELLWRVSPAANAALLAGRALGLDQLSRKPAAGANKAMRSTTARGSTRETGEAELAAPRVLRFH
jgi:hypothetical protein